MTTQATEMLRRLSATIDAHDWAGLPPLLHEDFTCRLVHTGETFDREGWTAFNANYPGFERFTLEDCIGEGDRAAGRAHSSGRVDDVLQHFVVAMFITIRDGLIVENVEVWTDVGMTPPPGTRA